MKKETTIHQSQTDWKTVDDMKDDEIDFSELPEVIPAKFAEAIVRKGLRPVPRKTQITLRLDTEVLTWFKDQGKGYQSNINALLKAYMEAHRNQGSH